MLVNLRLTGTVDRPDVFTEDLDDDDVDCPS